MVYRSEPGSLMMFQRLGHQSSILQIIREPIKASLLRLRKNFYFYKITVHYQEPITRFIAVEDFHKLIKNPLGEIKISSSGESFSVDLEKLEIALMNTEDLIEL